jgi:hypothetical protein
VFLSVMFGSFIRVISGMKPMRTSDFRMMRGLFMIASFVMLRCLLMMSGCMLMMFRCLTVVLGTLVTSHALGPPWLNRLHKTLFSSAANVLLCSADSKKLWTAIMTIG